MKRFLPVAIALFAASCVFAADALTVEAVTADQPVTIDGVLQEAVWEKGDWYDDFMLLGKPEDAATHQTRFKIAFDSENFYIGAQLDEPNMDQLKETIDERDGRLHTNDCLEFMIDPGGDRVDYFHFTVNSLGALYDAEMRQGGNVRSVEWDCPYEAGVAKQEESWSLEARVPLVHLGLDASATGDWALNVTRERYAGDRELSSFTPTVGGFHQPTNYATLKIPDVDLSRYLWTIKTPYDVQVMPADGQLTYSAKTHITNDTGEFWFISLAPGLQKGLKHDTGQRIHGGLDAGQGNEFSFSVPVAEQGQQTLQLRVMDRRNPRRVLAIRTLPVDLSYTPIAINVTQPYYRNNIYATQDLEEIRAEVTLSLTEDELEGATVTAALMRRTKQISRSEAVPAAEKVPVAVPIEDLEDGEYRLSVMMVDDGKTVQQASVPIHKLPPAPSGHEWRIGKGNILLHNGEPYLIYGWFGGSAEDLADPEVPYTACQYYSAQWFTNEEVIEQRFDPVAEAGGFITPYPYPTPDMMDAEDWARPLNDEERKAIRDRVEGLKDHPALWAWYLADEPELRPTLARRMIQIYETIAEVDPYHPQIMLNDTIAGIHKYVEACDILMPDPYPLFIQGGDAGRDINRVSEFMRACHEAGEGRRCIMVTPQAFNYGDYGKLNNREPTFTEMRNEAYQAIANRATGILWYTNAQQFNYPHMRVAAIFIGNELQDLKPAVFAEPMQDLQIEAEDVEHVEASVRRVDGEMYLFVVNTSPEIQEITVHVPGESPDELAVVSEGRSVHVKDGAITDTFGRYETHIYSSVETLADREQLSDALARAQKADADLKQPGNLAFRDSGVRVETSSARRERNMKVVDGARDGQGWTDETWNRWPDWMTLEWPEPQTIGRVVIYSSSIGKLELQVPEDEGWKTIAQAEDQTEDEIEITFEPRQIQTLRILCTGPRGDAKRSTIWEVEAYAK